MCHLRGARLCRAIRHNANTQQDLQTVSRQVARDETLFEVGTRPGLIGILRRGCLRREYMSRDGNRTLLGLVLPGGLVGELPGRTAAYALEAATDCEICLFPARAANRLATEDLELRRGIVADLEEQYRQELVFAWLRRASRRIERVVAFLILARDLGPSAPQPDGSVIVTVPLPRRDWADLCNTTVESISRQISDLTARGLVETLGKQRYRLRDLRALKALAGLDEIPSWRGRRPALVAGGRETQARPLAPVPDRWAGASLRH